MKIIPIFIPHAGCPHRCIYCDQYKISGVVKIPSVKEIHSIIERNIKTISKAERIEIAFFGGTFTLLPAILQKKYLEAVYPYVKSKRISGLRMSTHPEAVTKSSMKLFKENNGCLVELGVQSLDKDVLKKAKREMDFNIIKNASAIIKKSGLDLGVQVMLGLPGDTLQKSINTAIKLVELKPKTARIYPAIVLKGTGLGDLFRKNRYKPLSLENAIEWSARVADIFEKGGVKVIRIGLHPSEELNSKVSVLAGPYHVSFGEMARSRQMRHGIMDILGPEKIPNRSAIEIRASKKLFNFISGHNSQEKMFLENYYAAPIYLVHLPGEPDGSPGRWTMVEIRDLRKDIALIDPRMPRRAKDKLKKMNFYVAEAPLHRKLANPVNGHPDMMLFCHGKKVIYEPHMEDIAELLRNNGYDCVKGAAIKSKAYPKDVIYNACGIGGKIVRYKGVIEKNIENLKCKFIKVNQGYVKCSIIPVDDKHIITSDKSIFDKYIAGDGHACPLLVKSGHIKLLGYKSGFIGGASGVYKDNVFFAGSLKYHPDGNLIRDFIKRAGKNVIELYDGPLYDVGSVLFF